MAPKQAPKPEFQEGERVLCFHGPLLYEAKCLKVATEDRQVRYLIHYSGWNKNWDEWVPESRVLKYSEANLQKQRELQRANQEQQAEGRARGAAPGRRGGGAASLQQQKHVEALFQNIRISPPAPAGAASSGAATAPPSAAAPAASTSAAASTSGLASGAAAAAAAAAGAAPTAETPGPGRKPRKSKQKTGGGDGGGAAPSTSTGPARDPAPLRRRARGDPSSKSEGAAPTRADLRVQIPGELKRLLVLDWELVNQQHRVLAVPASKSADAVLDQYLAVQRAQGRRDHVEFAAEDLVAGVRDYFNALLGTQLLYEAERPQHDQVLAAHPDVPMSQLYGAPHLLRLFVRIGALLSDTKFDDKSLALLFGYLHDFLGYLAKDPAALLDEAEYKEAPPPPPEPEPSQKDA